METLESQTIDKVVQRSSDVTFARELTAHIDKPKVKFLERLYFGGFSLQIPFPPSSLLPLLSSHPLPSQ